MFVLVYFVLFLFGLRREDLSLLLLLLLLLFFFFVFLWGGGGGVFDPETGNRNLVSLLGCGH